MARFNLRSFNQPRLDKLRLNNENLEALDSISRSVKPINRRKEVLKQQTPQPIQPIPEFDKDPISTFLDLQHEAERRGLDLTLVEDTPFAQQFQEQFGRKNPGFLITDRKDNSVTLARDDIEEYILNRPLSTDIEGMEAEDETKVGMWGRIGREAKSFFIGDTVPEMALNIAMIAIPATLPLKGLHLGFKAIRLIGKNTSVLAKGTKEVRELVQFIKGARIINPEVAIKRTVELEHRLPIAEKILKRKATKALPEEELLRLSRGPEKGPLPFGTMEPPVNLGFTLTKMRKLLYIIKHSDTKLFLRQNAGEAVRDLVMVGKVPTMFEIRALEKTLGNELGKEIRKALPLKKRIEESLIDVLSLPKSMAASFDLSAPFRQGFFLIAHTKDFFNAGTSMFRALVDEKFAARVTEELSTRPTARMAREAGLFLSDSLNGPEEQFMSRFAENIPGIKQSARAYATFLNKLRADVFDSVYYGWKRGNKIDVGQKEIDGLARWINRATGRGSLGPLEQFRGALNVGLFSPAFVMSRLQLPLSILEGSGAVRMLVAKDVAIATGVAGTALALMYAAGAKIDFDPRSTGFGKGRINNTRIDLGAGELQVARMATQLITGKKKTARDKVEEEKRLDIAVKFLQYKLSPTAGVVWDLLAGQTFLGEDFTVNHLASAETIRQRVAPLFLQDLDDAIEEEGMWPGALLGLPAGFGVGVGTYHGLWDRRREAFEEMFPGEDFKTEHNKRGRALIRTLDSHPAVIEQLLELENRENIHSQEYRTEAGRRYEAINEEREAEFRGNVLAGRIQGKALRDMAKKFNDQRFALGAALFSELEGDIEADVFDATADNIALEYLTVELVEDPVTGNLDWEGRDEARSKVLDKAMHHNIPLEYIIGRGPKSFRGTKYQDPVVREVMFRFEDDYENLRPYWDIEKMLLKADTQANYIRNEIMVAESTGQNPQYVKILRSQPAFKNFERQRDSLRSQLKEINPTIDAQLYFWGFTQTLNSVHAKIILNRLSLEYLTK